MDLWNMEHVMQYDVVVDQSDGKGGKECILFYAESPEQCCQEMLEAWGGRTTMLPPSLRSSD
jgi:hypothetical protein